MLFIALTKLSKTRSERGAGMAEYALLLTLVAVLLVGAFTGLKDAIATAVTDAGNAF